MTGDTIAALSSGALPAGIAVVRTSGPQALSTAQRLIGKMPAPRQAAVRRFVDPQTGDLIDRGLVLWLPGPGTATGDDIVEYHCHGGRATVAALLRALEAMPGVRRAEPGEFTRRALANGVVDLTAAEGLADLLDAETELQRKIALRRSEGAVRREMDDLRRDLLALSAAAELAIDYDDEGESTTALVPLETLDALAERMRKILRRPSIERLRRGVRVAVSGPPNAGKSSLVNWLAGSDRAIVTDIAGTTRDSIEVPISLGGMPFVLIDTAGLRDSEDPVEQMGVERARREIRSADVVLWLGKEDAAPDGSILVAAKADLGVDRPGVAVSAHSGDGMEELTAGLVETATIILPSEDEVALTDRERNSLWQAISALEDAACPQLPTEILAEHLRKARRALGDITGGAGVEEMLDALFSRFCVGK